MISVAGGDVARNKKLADIAKVRKFMKMRTLLLLGLMILGCWGTTWSQTTAFTYQGKVTDTLVPGSATYDLEFALYTTAGAIVGSPIQRNGTPVNNGVFTVSLDFGATAFTGAARLLEIRVKRSGETSYTALTPRQSISSVPYAVRAKVAEGLDTSVPSDGSSLFGVVKVSGFGGDIGNIPPGGSWVFLGPFTALIVINDTQELIAATGSAVLSQTTTVPYVQIPINICRRVGGVGSILPITGVSEQFVDVFNRKLTHTVSISQVSLLPGSYEIGMCAINGSGGTFDNNGKATGYVLKHRN